VRVDVGYNLNPPFFPVREPCSGIVLPPGQQCPVPAHFEQLRHFNFFFSIGQTF